MIYTNKNLIRISSTFSAVLLMLLINAGCAVITETECRFADFATLGHVDASRGKLRNHFNKYHKKCLSYDIDIANEIIMYDMGRERGLLSYCNKTKYSTQCDRGGNPGKVKSYLHINAEMIRLRATLPKVTSSISR